MAKKESFITRLRKYVDGDADTWFEYFILAVIFVNVITLGLETTPFGLTHGNVLFIIDQICLWIFVVELLLKFIAFNKDYFKYKWNIFDLTIVLISIFATLPYFTVFRVFKIFRSVRIIKALKSFRVIKAMKFVNGLEHLQRILRAIVLSFSGIVWTLFLLFIIYYVYAIIGTHIFGSEFPDYFGTLGNSLLALFQIMTFDSWCSEIARPIIQLHSWAWIYFVTFALLSAFIIMNVIVGIVVDSIDESCRQYLEDESGETTVTIKDLNKQIAELQKQIAELSDKLDN